MQLPSPGPALERAGDLAASSRISTRATCCSSTRSIACHEPWRRSYTRRWRTSSSTSWSARAAAVDPAALPRFTLVGATTRTGMITGPLRDRFGLIARLDSTTTTSSRRSSCARPASSTSTSTPGGVGDRPALAWHAAHRQPPAAPGARLLRGARRRDDRRQHGTPWPEAVRRGRLAWTRSTGRSSTPSAGSPRRAGGAEHAGIAVGEQPETVEDMYKRFLIQQGKIARAREGGWRCRRPTPTSA